MKKPYLNSAFTLVEVLVAMTILAVIMVSVLSIFLFSSQMATVVNLNRVTQENIKNVIDTLSEGVRKDGIVGLRSFGEASCEVYMGSGNRNITSPILCLNGAEFAIGKKEGDIFLPLDNQAVYCADLKHICYVIKKDTGAGLWYPLSNSFLSFQKMDFILSNHVLPKLTIVLQARPAAGKGLSSDIVARNIITIQTTLSERLIETK